MKKQNKTRPLIDVCILEAGRFDMLSVCLDALYREAQSVPLTINIFDNASNRDELLANSELLLYQPEKDPAKGVVDFRVKHSSRNLGFPAGSNEAARMGNAPIILFLGDDVELLPGSLTELVDTFKDITVGVVGAKLLFPLSSTHPSRPAGKVQHVGMAINIQESPIHPLVGWSATNPKTCISRDVWAVTGACFAIRRDAFNKLGRFDTAYGLGTYEDTDMCMKVRKAGLRVYLNHKVVGYHYVGATAEKLKVAFPLRENREIFLNRWRNSGQVFWNEADFW